MTWNPLTQSPYQVDPRFAAAAGIPATMPAQTGYQEAGAGMTAAAGSPPAQASEGMDVSQRGPASGQAAPMGAPQPEAGAPEFAVPRVDVTETPESYLVELEMPGFEKTDISVYADENTLIVSAERAVEEAQGYRMVQRERPLRLERTVPLPVTVDVEETMATYEAGVCAIEVPKGDADDRKRIGFQ
jgi:HSP20 family protein